MWPFYKRSDFLASIWSIQDFVLRKENESIFTGCLRLLDSSVHMHKWSQIRCTQLYIYMYAFYPVHCIQCITFYLKISVDIWLIYYFIALGIYSFFPQWACTDFKYSLKSFKLNLLTLHSAFQVRVFYLPYSQIFFCI